MDRDARDGVAVGETDGPSDAAGRRRGDLELPLVVGRAQRVAEVVGDRHGEADLREVREGRGRVETPDEAGGEKRKVGLGIAGSGATTVQVVVSRSCISTITLSVVESTPETASSTAKVRAAFGETSKASRAGLASVISGGSASVMAAAAAASRSSADAAEPSRAVKRGHTGRTKQGAQLRRAAMRIWGRSCSLCADPLVSTCLAKPESRHPTPRRTGAYCPSTNSRCSGPCP